MYLFHELQTNSEHIAVPHPPQCAHWGTFPLGEGIALRYLYKFQFVERWGKPICTFKIIPGGDTTSYILYLVSHIFFHALAIFHIPICISPPFLA